MSEAPVAAAPESAVPPTTSAPEKVEEPGFKVFAGNLAYTTSDEGLKTFFSSYASDIISAQVILRGTRSAGYGFVAFSTVEAAEKAVADLNGKDLDGRPAIVELAKPAEKKDAEKKEKKASRKPGRRGAKSVPGEVTEAEANGEEKAPNTTTGTDEAAKPKKKKKKAAKKTPATDEATAAAPAEGEEAATGEKKPPRVKKPRTPKPTREAGQDPVGEPSKNMLFVANLGFNTDDAALHALFTEAGINVVAARIVRRRWGQPRKSKGYGFVDVGSEEEQQKAIAALEGKEVDGRAIAVKVAVNTPKEDEEVAAPAEETPAAPETVVVAT